MNREEFRKLCTEKDFSESQINEFELAISHGLNINLIANDSYSPESMHEIVLGMIHHVDAAIYANPELDSDSMRYIRLSLEAKYPIIPFANGDFDATQLSCIYDGFVHNLDVNRYANSEYSSEKMRQCYNALLYCPSDFSDVDFDEYDELQLYQIVEACRSGLDITRMLKSNFNDMQLNQISLGLRSGVNTDLYSGTEYDAGQMSQIRIGLEHGIEVSQYSKSSFTAFQMKQIRLGLEQGLDVSIYASEGFSDKVMLLIRLGLLEGIEVSEYAIPGISDEKADAIYHKLIDLQTAIDYVDKDTYEIGNTYLDLLGWGDKNAFGQGLLSDSHVNAGIADVSYHALPAPEHNADVVEESTKQEDSAVDAGLDDSDDSNSSEESAADSDGVNENTFETNIPSNKGENGSKVVVTERIVKNAKDVMYPNSDSKKSLDLSGLGNKMNNHGNDKKHNGPRTMQV